MNPQSSGKRPRAIAKLMSLTDNLRKQHEDALAMSCRLFDLIDGYAGPAGAYPIIMQLNRLIGLLRIHLAEEDIELYPRLTASGDASVARLAQRYVDEMGSLATDLEIFARHWSCPASIANRFEEFRAGAHELLVALAVRIEREDRYLYPLVDDLFATRRKAA